VSGDEVPKKLRQNVNTVHILTLIAAFQDGSTHNTSPIRWGLYKTGVCPRAQPQAVTEHDAMGWTDVHRKSVKVQVNTLMDGQWPLIATDLSSLYYSLLQRESQSHSYI